MGIRIHIRFEDQFWSRKSSLNITQPLQLEHRPLIEITPDFLHRLWFNSYSKVASTPSVTFFFGRPIWLVIFNPTRHRNFSLVWVKHHTTLNLQTQSANPSLPTRSLQRHRGRKRSTAFPPPGSRIPLILPPFFVCIQIHSFISSTDNLFHFLNESLSQAGHTRTSTPDRFLFTSPY